MARVSLEEAPELPGLDDVETARARVWIAEQRKKDNTQTTAGGRFTYAFTPTGVGTVIEVCDNLLSEKQDVTNYDTW
jgi:hypothetical protein